MNTAHKSLLDAICKKGVLASVSIRYRRGGKRPKPGDLGLDPVKRAIRSV